jgi:hypothetical protein
VEEVVGNILVNETMFEASWIYNKNIAESKDQIKQRIKEFTESNSTHALVITGALSFGLIKEKDKW